MYDISNQYDVPHLKLLICDKFARAFNVHWADDKLADAAKYSYTTIPEENGDIRDANREATTAHLELIRKSGMNVFIRTRPELMYELLSVSPGGIKCTTKKPSS